MTGFKRFWVLCLAAGVLLVSSGISKAAIYLTVNGVNTDSVTLLPSELCTVEIVSNESSIYDAFVGFEIDPPGDFVHVETKPEAGNVVVQRKSDNFALRLRDCLAFGKEVFLGIREFWITISQKSAGRPI